MQARARRRAPLRAVHQQPADTCLLPLQCVRSQQRGKFANELYTTALTAVLRSTAFSGDLLGAQQRAVPVHAICRADARRRQARWRRGICCTRTFASTRTSRCAGARTWLRVHAPPAPAQPPRLPQAVRRRPAGCGWRGAGGGCGAQRLRRAAKRARRICSRGCHRRGALLVRLGAGGGVCACCWAQARRSRRRAARCCQHAALGGCGIAAARLQRGVAVVFAHRAADGHLQGVCLLALPAPRRADVHPSLPVAESVGAAARGGRARADQPAAAERLSDARHKPGRDAGHAGAERPVPAHDAARARVLAVLRAPVRCVARCEAACPAAQRA